MASQTSALPDGSTLTKPAYTDSADIAVINTNMDKIVSNINAENQAIQTINQQKKMYAESVYFGNNSNAIKLTRHMQHQNYIISVSAQAGAQTFIVASNGGLSNFSNGAKAAWSSNVETLTIVTSTYRYALILSDDIINYELAKVDYNSFVDNSSFKLSDVVMKKKIGSSARYNFPTSNAEISGENNKYTVPNDGTVIIEVRFANTAYSQFALFINNVSITNGMVSSGEQTLNNVPLIYSFPVLKGDTIEISFYSTFTIKAAKLSLIY